MLSYVNRSGLSLTYYFWLTTFIVSGVADEAVAVPFLAEHAFPLAQQALAGFAVVVSLATNTPVAVAVPGASAVAVDFALQQDLPAAIWSLVQA